MKPFAASALAVAEKRLRPASRSEFRDALGACLALVAPVGMTEDDRAQWFRAAWETLDGIPADLLAQGCAVARKWADHHAKIVPAILREIEDIWQRRKAMRSDVLAAIAKMDQPPLAKEDRCTPEQVREIIKQVGLKIDGDEPERSPDYIPVEKRSAPTTEDYRRWGFEQEQAA